mmetsp:Transcript_3022/g.8732  ORF Transcript_3022/g.8732 Transcript_3022/m.8732 type:complete len:343 (+) Transcript_3022:297-1325(+)
MVRVRFNPMLVGVIANVFSLVGVPLSERAAARDQEKMERMTGANSGTDSTCSSADEDTITTIQNTAASTAARFLAPLARLIDLVDCVVDILFVVELFQMKRPEWAIQMLLMMILAHILSRCYEDVTVAAKERYGYGLSYLYYYGTMECIVFLLEDATTIYVYARLPNSFDENSVVDCLNVILSLASGISVSVLILLGAIRMVVRGTSSDWIPSLAITEMARSLAGCCRISVQRIINCLLLLKVIWVVSLVGFFSFIAFHNVLSGERLVGGVLEPLAQALYVSGIILSIINASRWPKGRCCSPCAVLRRGHFSVSASAADEESEEELGDIDLPLTKNKEVELV